MRGDVIDKVLLRDLPSLFGITDMNELYRLFTSLAYNSGNELSLEGLSKNAGLAKNTLKRYLDYLEAAFLIRSVYRVDQDGRRFQRDRTFKVYLTNSSIRSGLFTPLSEEDPSLGDSVETVVLAQNLMQLAFYARWKSGQKDQEVDFIFKSPGYEIEELVEVKYTDRVVKQRDSWQAILSFAQRRGVSEVIITTKTIEKTIMENGITIRFIPTSVYTYARCTLKG